MKEERIELFGASYKYRELRDSMPDLSRVAGIKPYTLFDGPERGVFAVDVWTGSGLRYTVVPDRGMNICNANYKGIPLDWSSGTGIVSPFLYDCHGWKWLRSFNGGLVHTCGLDNVGEPCIDDALNYDNKDFGGHGRISNTPAQELSWEVDETEEDYQMIVSGKCKITSAIEENLVLERTVESALGDSKILLKDRIVNRGYKSTPVLLLYHCNFGFPLLSAETTLSLPAKKAVDWNGNPVQNFMKIKNPTQENEDTVIYPEITDVSCEIKLVNPRLGGNGIGVYMKYEAADLPHLTVWRHYRKRSYVMGIEPGTCRVGGRLKEIKEGKAVYLEKDQSFEVHLEIGVIEGEGARID